MKITEVRIKLMDSGEDRLRGFCSVTFDDAFVVRDLKIIEGNNGPFVAMPSRKLTSTCAKCHTKNHLRSNYCNNCGKRQPPDQVSHDSGGRAKLYADIAHPVNAECREMIQNRVIAELESELERSREPGYYSRYDDGYDGPSRKHRSPSPAKHEPADRLDESVEKPQADVDAEALVDPEAETVETFSKPSGPNSGAQAAENRADSGHSGVQSGPHSVTRHETTEVAGSDRKPDNPNISSGRSKPANEEFGKGIFD